MLCKKIGLVLSERELRGLMSKFDALKTGTVGYKNFLEFLSPKTLSFTPDEVKLRERIREAAYVRSRTSADLEKLFHEHDTRRRGKSVERDFEKVVEIMGVTLSVKEMQSLLARYGASDGSQRSCTRTSFASSKWISPSLEICRNGSTDTSPRRLN